MCNSFVSTFLGKLDGFFTEHEIDLIGRKLEDHVVDYDIKPIQTQLANYNSLEKYMKMYIVTRKIEGLSSNSLKLYTYYLTDLSNNIKKDVSVITANDVRKYLYNVQKIRGISNRTLESRRVIVTGFLRWLYEEGYTNFNATRGIKPIRFQVNVKDTLTSVELEKVRRACISKRDSAIIETLYSTGCRVSELIGMKRDDIDLLNREVMVLGKGGKRRKTYLNAKAEVAITEYWNTRVDDNPYAFISLKKPYHKLSKERVEQIVRNIGDKAKIKKKVHPHLFRHTVASDALSRGMNVAEIQRFLGHKNIDTTMIYAKVCDEDIKSNHKKFI